MTSFYEMEKRLEKEYEVKVGEKCREQIRAHEKDRIELMNRHKSEIHQRVERFEKECNRMNKMSYLFYGMLSMF